MNYLPHNNFIEDAVSFEEYDDLTYNDKHYTSSLLIYLRVKYTVSLNLKFQAITSSIPSMDLNNDITLTISSYYLLEPIPNYCTKTRK